MKSYIVTTVRAVYAFLANYLARPKNGSVEGLAPRLGVAGGRVISGIQTSGGLLIRFVRPFDRDDAVILCTSGWHQNRCVYNIIYYYIRYVLFRFLFFFLEKIYIKNLSSRSGLRRKALSCTRIGAFNYAFISQHPVLRTTKTNPVAADVFYIKNIHLKRQIYTYIFHNIQ